MALAVASGRWDASLMPALDGKIVVVTGANAGIGFATALELARKAAHVVLGCRSEERGLQAANDVRGQTGNPHVEFMQLDIGSLASIKKFADEFCAKFDHLDILINNAGVMHPQEKQTADGFEAHFGVNHLGHFYLASLLFDSLKRAKSEARIVCVSSTNHRYVSPKTDFSELGRGKSAGKLYMNDYSVSKLCNLLFMYELTRRLKGASGDAAKIKAVGCHPGITMTNIITNAVKVNRLPQWAQRAFNKTVSLLPIFQTPEVGALPSLYAATVPSVVSGDYIGPDGWRAFWGYPAKDVSSPLSHSEEAAAALWKRSEELLNIQFEIR